MVPEEQESISKTSKSNMNTQETFPKTNLSANCSKPELDERLHPIGQTVRNETVIDDDLNSNGTDNHKPTNIVTDKNVALNNDCENNKKRKAVDCVSLDDSSDDITSIQSPEKSHKKIKSISKPVTQNGFSELKRVSHKNTGSESDNSLEIDEPESVDLDSDIEDTSAISSNNQSNIGSNKFKSNINITHSKSSANVKCSNNETMHKTASNTVKSVPIQNGHIVELDDEDEDCKVENKKNHLPALDMECSTEALSECQQESYNKFNTDFLHVLDLFRTHIPNRVSYYLVYVYKQF